MKRTVLAEGLFEWDSEEAGTLTCDNWLAHFEDLKGKKGRLVFEEDDDLPTMSIETPSGRIIEGVRPDEMWPPQKLIDLVTGCKPTGGDEKDAKT